MNKKQKHHKTIIPGHSTGVNVLGTSREDLAYALKTFKRKVKSTGTLEKLKDNKTFTKPSVKRREQLSSAKYLQQIKDFHQKNS
jgi:small subunit ribosomal protein S21